MRAASRRARKSTNRPHKAGRRDRVTALLRKLNADQRKRLEMLLEYWLQPKAAEAEDRADWNTFALEQFAKSFGPDEPDYTEADIKERLRK